MMSLPPSASCLAQLVFIIAEPATGSNISLTNGNFHLQGSKWFFANSKWIEKAYQPWVFISCIFGENNGGQCGMRSKSFFNYIHIWLSELYVHIYKNFTFIHLEDAFIQSDLQYRQFIWVIILQYRQFIRVIILQYRQFIWVIILQYRQFIWVIILQYRQFSLYIFSQYKYSILSSVIFFLNLINNDSHFYCIFQV